MVSEQEGSSTDVTSFEEWLRAEEIVRLLHCVYTLECFEVIFLDFSNIFTLSNFTRRRPCSEGLWRCRGLNEWLERRLENDCTPQSGPFISGSRIVEAYIEERIFLDQIRSLRLFKTLLASNQQKSVESLVAFGTKFLADIVNSEVAGLGTSFQDSIFYIIAILQQIPIKTIYACLGWQTSESGMELSRARFAAFLHQKGAAARRCFWHAVNVFRALREVRYFSCYDAVSLCVAINYIWTFDRMVTHPGEGEIVRIDRAGPRVESWIRSGGEVRLHITGVGVLDGLESGSRLLTATIRTLQSQVAWQGISRAIAECLAQYLRGERPSYVLD